MQILQRRRGLMLMSPRAKGSRIVTGIPFAKSRKYEYAKLFGWYLCDGRCIEIREINRQHFDAKADVALSCYPLSKALSRIRLTPPKNDYRFNLIQMLVVCLLTSRQPMMLATPEPSPLAVRNELKPLTESRGRACDHMFLQ